MNLLEAFLITLSMYSENTGAAGGWTKERDEICHVFFSADWIDNRRSPGFVYLASEEAGSWRIVHGAGRRRRTASGCRRNTHGRLSRCDGRKKILRFPKETEILKESAYRGICL